MLGQWSATKPSRSDELLDADEQERIAGQIRQQFDSLAPSDPPNPIGANPTLMLLSITPPPSSLTTSPSFPSFNPFNLSLTSVVSSNPQAVISDEPPKDVVDEFVETQYYKELSSIDKQHHTTGSGFIRVESVGGDGLNFQNSQIINGGGTVERRFHNIKVTRPQTTGFRTLMSKVFVSTKPNRSDSS
ncbi:hypothetical protein K1719_032163 [Acacia pycnantha]|nr:hypothetical protein K1719_032163 [Acacia pycnantha]